MFYWGLIEVKSKVFVQDSSWTVIVHAFWCWHAAVFTCKILDLSHCKDFNYRLNRIIILVSLVNQNISTEKVKSDRYYLKESSSGIQKQALYNYASEVIAGKQFMVVYSIETGF